MKKISPQLEAVLVRMAREHGLGRVQQRLDEGKFGSASEDVRRWLRPRMFWLIVPRIGAWIVGVTSFIAAVVTIFK